MVPDFEVDEQWLNVQASGDTTYDVDENIYFLST